MLDEEWQCVSREASCVLGVRSLVMSYKFVLKCFYLLLIVFAHISNTALLSLVFYTNRGDWCFRKHCVWGPITESFQRTFGCYMPTLPEARNSRRAKDNCCVLKGTFNGYILDRAGRCGSVLLEVAASEILKLNGALRNTFLSQTWAEPISRTLFADYLTTCKCTTALLYLARGPIKRPFNMASAPHRPPVFL